MSDEGQFCQMPDVSDDLSLNHQLEQKTRELEAVLQEQAEVEQITAEVQNDIEEMSKTEVYQRYTYLTVKEIRDSMVEQSSQEPAVQHTNNGWLDIEDLDNLHCDEHY